MKNKLRLIMHIGVFCTLLWSYPGNALAQKLAFQQGLIGESIAHTHTIVAHHQQAVVQSPLTHNDQSQVLQKTITGKVTDRVNNEPLTGVSIQVKGTANGTLTDNEGNYKLSVEEDAITLVFTSIGYVTQEVAIQSKTTINVVMNPDIHSLSQMVVIGYGKKERGELTGSVATLSGETIQQTSQANITQALQGKVPGLIVDNRGGIPGSNDASILIRGKSTLGDNSPLVVIDGIPRDGFGQLSPNDIASISVLKDASAAIYGARAANGVILITTKRGKAGESNIRLSSSYGISGFTKLPQYMNSFQYATWENEISDRYGMTKQWSEDDLTKFRDGTDPLTHPNTNFNKEVFKDWASELHEHISATGGSEKIQYFISGDYLHQGGLYRSNDLKYNQYQIRSNLDAQVTKNLKVGFDLSARIGKQHSTSRPVNSMIPFINNWAFPYNVGYYPNGLPGVGGPQGQNPVIISSDKAGWIEDNNKIFTSKLSFNLNLDWLTNGLGLEGYGAFSYLFNGHNTFYNTWTVYNYNATTGEYDPQHGENQDVGATRTLQEVHTDNQIQLYHIGLTYNRSFGRHNFNAFIAYEQEQGAEDILSGYRRDLISGQKPQLFTGGQSQINNDGSASETGRVNYFGSLSYNYLRKYLIDVTLRHDGSFNFPQGKRFGTFPGVSAGWVISKEPFMNFTHDWLDNLKLRASWAEMGNDRIAAFQYLTQYALNSYYLFGESPVRENGFTISNTANPDITWEVADTKNFGLDANLLNGGLSMSINYFFEKRRHILITRSAAVPEYTALELPNENLGKVNNKGVDFDLNYQGNLGDLHYSIGGNFTYNRSKVIFMDEPKSVSPYRAQEGHPIDSWVVYKTDGLYKSQDEIDGSPHLGGTKPGDIKYVDVNGDGTITGDDQVREYSSAIPEIEYGFNVNVDYKGFEFSAFFNGQARAKTMILFLDGGNKPEYLFNERWTENNINAKYPRAYQRTDIYNTKSSDFWLYNASFLRLNNIELGYNFPSKWLSRINLKGIKLYIRGANLVTFGLIQGEFDPEINTSNAAYYPQQKLITTGIDVDL